MGQDHPASYLPCPELAEVLLDAYAPCPEFDDRCPAARWAPRQGHVPRGFIGALGRLDEVKLVLLMAEPGNPLPGESHDGPDARSKMESTCAHTFKLLQAHPGSVHRNLRYILNRCWPERPLREQLKRTWITESYLCSAGLITGPVPSGSVNACFSRYLRRELELLEGRVIVALGGKAQARIRSGVRYHPAFAVGAPGCNFAGAKPSWDAIPRYLQAARKAFR
jgi:hypothetical protein